MTALRALEGKCTMRLRKWLVVGFVMLTLGGCGPWVTGQGQAQYAPYSHDGGSDMRSGPDGGGSGGGDM